MTKKKENKKKKEEKVLYVSDTHCTDGKCITSSWWGKKRKPKRDLTIESFKEEDPSKWFIKPKYRLKAQVIDETSCIRGPKPPPPYDPLLAYLEWKVSLPWHRRLFLP